MNEINVKVTSISLAIDAKADKDDLMTVAKEIYEWLSEGFEQAVENNIQPLRPVN